MLEKILQKLQAARGKDSLVTDRTLTEYANTLLPLVADDASLEKLDLAKIVTSMEGNMNHVIAEKVKNTKSGEAPTTPPVETPTTPPKTDSDVPEYIKAIIKQNEIVMAKLQTLESGKITDVRTAKLQETLADLPDYVKTPILDAFKRANFKDDEDFGAYINSVNTTKETYVQAAKEAGLNTYSPQGNPKTPTKTGETAILADAMNLINSDKK